MFKRFLQLTSINAKLTAVNFASSGIVILLIFLIMLGYQYFSVREAILNEVRVQARIIESNSTAALAFNDRKLAEEILDALGSTPDVLHATIYQPDGTPFANYIRPNSGHDHVDLMPTREETQFGWVTLRLAEDIRQHDILLGRLFVEASLGRLYNGLAFFSIAILLVGLIALLFARRFLFPLTRIIIQPLSELTGLMNQVSNSQNYTIRASIQSSDETGILALGFNEMLARIQERELNLEMELSRRKKAENRIDRLAYFDSVTHLHNRHFFIERLTAAINNAAQFDSTICLMFINLDNFKMVNDTLGHPIGDLVLMETGRRLKQVLRTGDIVCRLGGDEFAFIIENDTDSIHLEKIAQKVLFALSERYLLESNEIFLGASLGLSLYPNNATDPANLLRCANTAMYHAKKHGKNRYKYYSADMSHTSLMHFTMGNSLRKALERDEFLLYYQPKTDMQSGLLLGFEALLRWQHPEMGMVSPLDFIPLAEETGLIVPIGEWVLRTACRQAKAWQDVYGINLTVAVNLSGRQLKELGIIEKILQIVDETSLPHHLLELELTESILMESAEDAIEMLKQLHSAGVCISIDVWHRLLIHSLPEALR